MPPPPTGCTQLPATYPHRLGQNRHPPLPQLSPVSTHSPSTSIARWLARDTHRDGAVQGRPVPELLLLRKAVRAQVRRRDTRLSVSLLRCHQLPRRSNRPPSTPRTRHGIPSADENRMERLRILPSQRIAKRRRRSTRCLGRPRLRLPGAATSS